MLASLASVHPAGEGQAEMVLATRPGNFTVTRTDEALTPCGGLGLAAWRGFLKHLGIIEPELRSRQWLKVVGQASSLPVVAEQRRKLFFPGVHRTRQAGSLPR